MIAALYERPGPAAEVLRVEEIDRPEPGPGEVLVAVGVSGVNPTDWKSRSGATGGFPEGVPFQVPNQDGAGVIEAVGEGVDEGRVGQRVWLYFAAWQRQWGTAAEYTVVPEEQAVPLPEEASFELGASLGIPAVTAQHCLFADGPLEGRRVLVAGGAGAVGRASIELARFAGAHVVATVSSEEKAQLAVEAGAHETLDYTAGDAVDRAAELKVDRVVELDLARNLELDLAACATGASIASYAGESGDPEVPVRGLMVANVNLRFVLVYTVPRDELRAAVDGVAKAVAEGALTTLPLHRFPLERIADAHDAVEGGVTGKVLVELGSPS